MSFTETVISFVGESASTEETSLLSFDIHQILEVLPHRYPFLLVDRVTVYIPGERIEGIKNVSINEPHFNGHFPGAPIMPGVLQIEALAQLAGLYMKQTPEGDGRMGLLTGINQVRFRRQVIPGDQLHLIAIVQRIRLPLCKFQVQALVGSEVAVEGDISFTMVPVDSIRK